MIPKALQEAMERILHDGGAAFVAIGAVSAVAWVLLFVKWLQIQGANRALSESEQEPVRVRPAVLNMWVEGEYGRIFSGVGPIEASAALLPLLGLLGTVLGMLQTFEVIKIEGTGDPRLMANGIRQALLTTQAGILAAIPVLVGLRFVSSRATRLGARIERELQDARGATEGGARA